MMPARRERKMIRSRWLEPGEGVREDVVVDWLVEAG
jgi:hypothetical protein